MEEERGREEERSPLALSPLISSVILPPYLPSLLTCFHSCAPPPRCMHGICLPINAFSYSCKCLEGHGGVLCDEEEALFNPCQAIKCKHGKCRLSGLAQPYCECSSGYTGASCDRGKPAQPARPSLGKARGGSTFEKRGRERETE